MRYLLFIILGLVLSSMTIYDIKFEDAKTNKVFDLSKYRGKVIMIVNTASMCGFTKQYNEMQALWDKYKNNNFVIIAVPTNDFGSQEPKSDDEIVNFCEVNFDINFPIMKKVTSKGEDRHDFFKLVKKDFSIFSGPKWNFYKYIYDKEGKPLGWFSSFTKPNAKKILDLIEKNISK
jgi:glutathione peroxidase